LTSTTLFRVASEVFERFPDYIVACVVARGISTATATGRLDSFVRNGEIRARATYADLDLKSQAPFAAWRDAFSTAGWSPSRFPASVEAIHKRVQRGDDLPRINPLVDVSNSAVLFYAVPVGTHDIDSFDGSPLEVRLARADDLFVSMNDNLEKPDPDEIVYAVGSDIRTRRWVWRQGRNGLVSGDAKNLIFPIDGFRTRTNEAVLAAQNYLANICETEFGASVDLALITAADPELFLEN
jgi:DNA/RNA-binding domain of Phe-tRNA-synthetase-like protein